MYFLNPIFALLLSLFAVLCIRVSFKWIRTETHSMHFGTIDGLRGYLAFFVFLHHAAVWFPYITTGEWAVPKSHLYAHLGQSSVAVFFMITSFLFYDKLLDNQDKEFNWRGFFIGRFFRLTPLYFSVMIFLFVMVAILSGGQLSDSLGKVLFSASRWLTFTIAGSPAINQINALVIVAGVTWSLPYEWYFYLVLPLVALTTGSRPRVIPLTIGVIGLCLAIVRHINVEYVFIFCGGIAAARLIRIRAFRKFASTPLSSVVVMACMCGVLFFPEANKIFPTIFLMVAFSLIAGGADLFGMLLAPTSRRLGELAYSIYLLHGILLFIILSLVIGKANVSTMSVYAYWTCIALLVPFLLGFSALTFRYIEKPGISLGKKLSRRKTRANGSLSNEAQAVRNAVK